MNDLSRYTPNCPISPFSLRTGLNSGESELLLHHGKVRLLCSPWFGWAMVETWYAALESLDGPRSGHDCALDSVSSATSASA